MYSYPRALRKLIAELEKLPGIGTHTATRLAFHLLDKSQQEIEELAGALTGFKKNISFCSKCHNMAEEDPCQICSSSERDQSLLCVVESPRDVIAMEKTGEYKGLYHVLRGLISPLDDVGPEDLALANFRERLQELQVQEVIIATDPSTEGDATALYLKKILQGSDIKITRLAQGLPAGGDLEYADEVTLSRALSGRSEIKYD